LAQGLDDFMEDIDRSPHSVGVRISGRGRDSWFSTGPDYNIVIAFKFISAAVIGKDE
jgi:hypothetical protein